MKILLTLFSLLFTGYVLADFADTPQGHPYHEAIEYVQRAGIVEGYPDGTYRPDVLINRVEFLKILLEADTNDRICTERYFLYPDVVAGSWYDGYVQEASNCGIVTGYPDGSFQPGAPINYAEASKIVVETWDRDNAELYADHTQEHWYERYIAYLDHQNIKPRRNIQPSDLLSRGEMAEIIFRLSHDVTPAEYETNPDLGGQFRDAVLRSRDPDCRAYAMDENEGNYSSSGITDTSNGISDGESHVHIDMVIANGWNSSQYDYANVTVTTDPTQATHCRMVSNMIPNHDFGVEVTRPSGGGWVKSIDHGDLEVTYIPVNPAKGNTPTDTPRNPPVFDFDGILLNGVGIAMDSGFCYKPGVTTGPRHLQTNEVGNASGCGPNNVWFELPAYTIWDEDAQNMAAVFDEYFGHGFVGTYHYHALTHPLQADNDQTQPPANGQGSPVIGFAPDGFPIYGHWFIDQDGALVKAESGYELKPGNSRTPIAGSRYGTPPTPWDIENRPENFETDFGFPMGRYEEDWYYAGTGNLDECNGAFDINGDYGYYTTDKYPFTPPCIFGDRDPSFGKLQPTLD